MQPNIYSKVSLRIFYITIRKAEELDAEKNIQINDYTNFCEKFFS